MFFPGRMSPEKTDFSWFRRLRPAEVCDACPTGRVRWDGKAGGCLWGVPCRASPLGRKGRRIPAGVPCRASLLGRKGRRMPVGRALPGQSVGTERPADVCGACPAGRVRWGGKAGVYLWGVPYRASPLGWKGWRMPVGRALPGESVGAEGPADACGCALPGESVGAEGPADACGPVRWVGEAGGNLRRFLGPLWEWFSCSGPMFSFWEKFF